MLSMAIWAGGIDISWPPGCSLWNPDAMNWPNNAASCGNGPELVGAGVVAAGGSVTVIIAAGELPVSPGVVLVAVTDKVATGCPVPV